MKGRVSETVLFWEDCPGWCGGKPEIKCRQTDQVEGHRSRRFPGGMLWVYPVRATWSHPRACEGPGLGVPSRCPPAA